MTAQIDLTITDDFPLAQAIVIISAVPIMRTEDLTPGPVFATVPSTLTAKEWALISESIAMDGAPPVFRAGVCMA